jgi:hypothetical protein
MLAMGHRYVRTVEEGDFKDFAALARKLKVSRAWISMCVDLTFLAPKIQERILLRGYGIPPIQQLILMARHRRWEEQQPQVGSP